MSVGQALLQVREERNLTQRQLGERAGIAASYLSRIENDHVQPTMATLNRIAEALEVPVSAVFRVSERGEREFKHRCPVSSSGACVGEHIRGRHGPRRIGSRATYGEEELRVLKMADYVMLHGPQAVRRALAVVLESLIEKAGRPSR